MRSADDRRTRERAEELVSGEVLGRGLPPTGLKARNGCCFFLIQNVLSCVAPAPQRQLKHKDSKEAGHLHPIKIVPAKSSFEASGGSAFVTKISAKVLNIIKHHLR